MNRELAVFGDLPLPIKICMIGGAIFLAPYLIIQAWREGRRDVEKP
jgi:Sec-independent protein secretion pathway component TatC